MHCSNAVKSSLGAHFPSHLNEIKLLNKKETKEKTKKKNKTSILKIIIKI